MGALDRQPDSREHEIILAADPTAAVPDHDWQEEELTRRKANLMNNPASGLSWDEVEQRVRTRCGR
jgi:hypothetical protein